MASWNDIQEAERQHKDADEKVSEAVSQLLNARTLLCAAARPLGRPESERQALLKLQECLHWLGELG